LKDWFDQSADKDNANFTNIIKLMYEFRKKNFTTHGRPFLQIISNQDLAFLLAGIRPQVKP
jgi:hypothetical protein